MTDTAELTFHDLTPSESASDLVELADVAKIANGKPMVRYSATEAGLHALRTDLKSKAYDLTKMRDNEAARADRLCAASRCARRSKSAGKSSRRPHWHSAN